MMTKIQNLGFKCKQKVSATHHNILTVIPKSADSSATASANDIYT